MMIEKTIFGKLPDGRKVNLYTLTNKNGMMLEVTPYGCRIIRLLVPDRNEILGDMLLGHKTLEEYLGVNFQGSFIGRYANRIGGAEFTLGGKTYTLDKNDGNNSLHGGTGGYHQVLFAVEETTDGDEPSITFSYLSPDMEEGYPGALDMKVKYTLTAGNTLKLEYTAVSDKETVFNPTNHAFFNLSGDYQKDILSTVLTLNAGKTTLISDDLIPTSEIADVAGTVLDFTKGKKLGDDMFSEEKTVAMNGGFDHNFCVEGEGLRKFGEAYEPYSGRVMEVYSDLPAIQLYTFNQTAGLYNKDGSEMKPHTAFCLETQYYPDSPNKPEFPFATVKPGVPFKTTTEYRFSTKK